MNNMKRGCARIANIQCEIMPKTLDRKEWKKSLDIRNIYLDTGRLYMYANNLQNTVKLYTTSIFKCYVLNN